MRSCPLKIIIVKNKIVVILISLFKNILWLTFTKEHRSAKGFLIDYKHPLGSVPHNPFLKETRNIYQVHISK